MRFYIEQITSFIYTTPKKIHSNKSTFLSTPDDSITPEIDVI